MCHEPEPEDEGNTTLYMHFVCDYQYQADDRDKHVPQAANPTVHQPLVGAALRVEAICDE
jgi:hypothetical protein